jgi:hypothetical protein
MLIGRHFAVAMAFALINVAALPDAARANESGLFSPGFPPWPTPPNIPSRCRYERQCGHHGLCLAVGLSAADFCQRISMASSG